MSNTVKRKYIIAGNWKMNLTSAEGAELTTAIIHDVGNKTDVTVVVCPPFTALTRVGKTLENSNIQLGAQNMHPEASGAYTGEVSAAMLRDLFVNYVILGHSERRQYFGETDAFINRKVKTALDNNLKPILCVGETLEEREAGKTLAVIRTQIEGCLEGIKPDHSDNLIIAYEPVWAIGTGKTATPEQAQEVHAAIRKMLAEKLSATHASGIRILYGGSMKPSNADDLLAQPDIDGGLIGGAALEAKSFVKLVESAQQRKA